MADSRVSDLGTIPAVAGSDEIHIVDKSDTTDNAGGSSKKVTVDNLVAGAAAPPTHTHTESDITDLGSYSTTGHTHTEADITDLDHTDADAIHDNVSGEISLLTEKTTPVSADLLIIEDSAASNAKKKVQIGNLPGGGAASGTMVTTELTVTESGGSFKASWTDGDYDNIRIVAMVKSSVSATTDFLFLYFNSDYTNSNYRGQLIFAQDASTPGGSQDDAAPRAGYINGNTSGYTLSPVEIIIPAIQGTHEQAAIIKSGNVTSTTSLITASGFVQWTSTANVTAVELRTDNYGTDNLSGIVRIYGESTA